ncbi:hypothetical protein PseBG33_2238 [Pseudomonas synxantha BG33R]|nr:hypothetical protein PseBG33_2238 [Pseudomonas synxantha BG33R]
MTTAVTSATSAFRGSDTFIQDMQMNFKGPPAMDRAFLCPLSRPE